MALTQVSTDGVKNDAISHNKIPANAIQASELADNAVDTAAIADGNVTLAKLATDSVGTDKLVANAVTNAKLANNAVANGNIANDAVNGSKIADNSIDSEHYADGSIDTAHIANSQVTADKLANDSVTEIKIVNNAVATAKIPDSAVTGAKIASGAVSLNKLASDSVGTAKIIDQAVTLAKLPHGTSSNDGKFLRANNGADPSFETMTAPAITAINGAGNNRLITSDGGTTVTAEDSVTFDGNELKTVLGSTTPKFTLKRSGNVDSADNIFSQVSTQDANGTVVGELTWRRDSANDESYLDLETKTTGVNNAQPSVRLKGSNGTLYAVGLLGRSNNNQPAYFSDTDYYGTSHPSTVHIKTKTNGGECGLFVRGQGQGGGSSSPHSCIRVDATSCANNADQYGVYLKGRQQLVMDTTGFYADVYGSYSTTYCYRAHLQKQVGAYTNGYSFHSKITETNSGGASYHFRGDDGTTQRIRIERDGDIDNSNNSYGSLSDVKLKENIVDANSQWDDVKAIKVRNYNFKESTNLSTHKQLGVVAQELETVSAGLIKTENDVEIDPKTGEGKVTGTTKSVKYSVLYMKAFKALQEAMARIEVLEAKVA